MAPMKRPRPVDDDNDDAESEDSEVISVDGAQAGLRRDPVSLSPYLSRRHVLNNIRGSKLGYPMKQSTMDNPESVQMMSHYI